MNPLDINETIECLAWIVGILLLALFVPRQKTRDAWLSFMFMQSLTWPLGLLVVKFGLITYPSRFFQTVSMSSFTFEFFVYPVVSALYNVHFPALKKVWVQVVYAVAVPTLLTVVEAVLLHYTNLIRYNHWSSAATWLSDCITLQISYIFYRWFFGNRNVQKSDD